ncbi:TIR domain-containing protein [Micromonospora arida]|uniref:TIR domain-containing protein n=1 Tax=Micromonospora arida TaxID=2203715 RepID=UPI003CE87540
MSPPVDHLKVFVSFSSRDGKPHAARLAHWLRTTMNASPFLFTERPPGEHFPTVIQRAIRECNVLLALMTPGYAADTSVVCAQEVGKARDLDRPVIPLRMTSMAETPLQLSQITRLDLSTPRAPDWAALRKRLMQLSSPEYQRTRLLKERELWARHHPGDDDFFELADRQIADEQRRLELDAASDDAELETELATERGARRRPRSTSGPGTRFLSRPPAVPPAEFKDRVTERAALLDAVRDAKSPLVVLLTGEAGSGKTAMLSKLADALDGSNDQVRWFAYLPAFGQLEVSPATVLGALARMADDDREDGRCQEILRDGDVSWRSAASEILDRLRPGRVVLALDNVERILDTEGRLTDTELGRLIETIHRREQQSIVLVLASSRPIELPLRPSPATRIELGAGLDANSGAELLMAMDARDRRGLGTATNTDRQFLSHLAQGHPRTLELVTALLHSDARCTVASLIASLETELGDATPAAYLMDRILDVLPDLDRMVLTALAVFGQPVPAVAVDFLLGPYRPKIRSASTLQLLSARRVIRADGDRYFVPSADDAAIVLGGIPAGNIDEYDEESFHWTLLDLSVWAAEYQISVARENPQRVEDLGPQFSEVELRIQAGDLNGAVQSIEAMDDGWLFGWGQTYLLAPWLRRLVGEFTEPEMQVPVLSMLANGHLQLGEFAEATSRIGAAAELVQSLPVDRVVEFHLQAGSINYQHKRVEAAARHYADAFTHATHDGQWHEAVKARSGLAICATRTGDLLGADSHIRAARDLLIRHHDNESLLSGELWLNEAWLRGFEGDTDAAESCYMAARKISRDGRHRDTTLEGWTYCAQSARNLDLRRFDDAHIAAQRAIDCAALRNDNRVLREAKNRIVLALLCRNELAPALEEARFATTVEQRHTGLPAFTLRGLVEYRLGDPNADASFDKAYRLADDYLRLEKQSFEVYDLLGIVLLVRAIDDPLTYEERMVEAFQNARRLTSASGAVGRVQLLIDQVAPALPSPVVDLARAAAASLLAD